MEKQSPLMESVEEEMRRTGVIDESSQGGKNFPPLRFSTPVPNACEPMTQCVPDDREQVIRLNRAIILREDDNTRLDESRGALLSELARAQRETERLNEEVLNWRRATRVIGARVDSLEVPQSPVELIDRVTNFVTKVKKDKSVLIGALQYIASPRQWLSRLCAKPNETMSVQECAQRALNLTGNALGRKPEGPIADAIRDHGQAGCARQFADQNYYDLVIGEIVRQGDEILETHIGESEWMKVNTSVGGRVTGEHKWRRPVLPATGDGC